MSPPACLVTGGTGFVGQHLVSHLVQRGHSTRVLTRRSRTEAVALLGDQVEIVTGDICDQDAVRNIAQGIEIVFHLAGGKDHRSDLESVNIQGTRNILAASIGSQIRRFVHVSSAGVFGVPRDQMVSEDSPRAPRSLYERTKSVAEDLVLGVQGKLPVSILRPTNIFGEFDPARQLLNLTRSIHDGRFRYIGDARAMLNYVYAGDVAQACHRLATETCAAGQVYIVSDSCSLTEFVDAISAYLSVPSPRARVPQGLAWALAACCDVAGHITGISFPLSRAKVRAMRSRHVYSSERLRMTWSGWPTLGWREGLKRTLDWYRLSGLLPSG